MDSAISPLLIYLLKVYKKDGDVTQGTVWAFCVRFHSEHTQSLFKTQSKALDK